MAATIRHVVAQFLAPGGAVEQGTVAFYAVPPLRFTDTVPGPMWGETRLVVPLDAAGKLAGNTGVPLIANDSPGLADPNTCWIVEFALEGASPQMWRVGWFTLRVADPDPVNLTALLRTTDAPTPAAQYTLLSLFHAHEADVGDATHAAHLRPDGTTITADPDGTLHSVSGTGDKHYVHTQGSPDTTWTITHNLQKHPAITVVDSAGSVYEAQIEYPSLNQAIVRTSAAFSGVAYCN